MRRRGAALLALTVVVLVGSGEARSEPYLAVFKGMQCSACHSHHAGGGKRNVYGNLFAQNELPAKRLGDPDAKLWTGQVLDRLGVGANLRTGYRYVDIPNRDSISAFDINRATVYLEATVVPNRLALYLDQQVAPGSSLNREAYLLLKSRDQRFQVTAGQFFLPYGLRLQDDTAFIRRFTGTNFTTPDRGVQVGYESGPWSTQLSLTNGSGGGAETDTGKRLSWLGAYVKPTWRVGASFNLNDADAGDRRMQNLFVGLLTGPLAWLFEADLIIDDLPDGSERDSIAALVEANWQLWRGHNLKFSYDYFDPNDDVDEDHQVRFSLLYEYTPVQFVQGRFGIRIYDGVPQEDLQNREEFFAELHGFF